MNAMAYAAKVVCEAVDRTGEDARIVDLIRRLNESGASTIEIGQAVNPDTGESEWRVEWRDEYWTIVAWDQDLLMALEKCADDVNL